MTAPADTLRLEVTALGAQGDGIAAWPDGTRLHVPGALPAEQVQARRAGPQRAELLEVLRASPDRVVPPCRHVAEGCGGCALQHWAMPAQSAWKRARLADALARAGFPDAPVAEAAETPPRARRRADFALRRRPDGTVAVGFHPRGAAEVLDLSECHVLDPRLFALAGQLRVVLRRLSALGREGSAVVNLLDTGPDLLLRTDRPLDVAGRRLLAAFSAQAGIPRIAWALGEALHETAAQAGPVSIALSGVAVAPPPGAFLQASPQGEAAIVGAVLAGLPAKLPVRPRIADLYAGVGTLSFPLAARGRVDAFEGDAGAAAALDEAARRAVARVKAQRRDLARRPLLAAELAAFDAVVLDPPFAGAAEQVAQIARSKVTALVYVSCNPAALARDGRALAEAGFRVTAATPVDQFRWSAQVEAVVALARG